MRKLVVTEVLTADGVMEDPRGWHTPSWDEDMAAVADAQMAASDTLVLGRTTYEGFAADWPGAEAPGADHMNGVAKYVVSTTLTAAHWNNTTVIRRDVAGAIAGMKGEEGGNIVVRGSATLVRWLLGRGLVDEFDLLIAPVIVGTGKRLFSEDLPRTPLRVVRATPLPSGVQHVVYAPSGP
ncbi:dihydrofolate reductase family protein [Streptomyces sp. NPDC001985]|uniref:dihydrofolate reductase family protein n=1 Tax=Streptomyces sp. NPDC001985 TaxID=3154406 RepID=UPI0033308D1F